MNLATKMQKKLDEVYYDNYYQNSRIGKVKAILAALGSGAIDGAIIAYPIIMIGCCLGIKNNLIKK